MNWCLRTKIRYIFQFWNSEGEGAVNTNLWIVVPCYNEEMILEKTAVCLKEKMEKLNRLDILSGNGRIVFVDDGSSDGTWQKIRELAGSDRMFLGIRLSHNRGQQNALLAGMIYAKDRCDCVATIDADMQDDIDVLPAFLEKYAEGCQIVYGVRKNRNEDTVLKRATAQLFYRIMKLMGAEVFYNHADYRLMSRKALEALAEYSEVNLFLRGMIPQIGMKSAVVYYDRKARTAGKTKYSVRKMISLAINGLTSFSERPLHLISVTGIICSLLSLLGMAYALISYFFGYTVPGWTAIVCSIWLLGGIQLMCLGIVGEYIGRIFSEVKRRPRYFIEETTEMG